MEGKWWEMSLLLEVICVHSKCIEWTPQVYYEGDIIKNLDTELARAAKLKCSSCGMKGAALGCYLKSCRRSYHVPCAFEIQDCRWDMENFVMMCPIHKSVKFPSEKSKSEACQEEMHPETSPPTTEQLKFWARSLDGPKEWVLYWVCSILRRSLTIIYAVKSHGKLPLACFRGKNLCLFPSSDEKEFLHQNNESSVASSVENGSNYGLKWSVNEEPYEISLDNYGCSGGPKAGRLRASTDTHAALETWPPSLVVYNCDPPQGCMFEEESSILQPKRLAESWFSQQIGCQVIQHTWILESIAACKLVPFF
ncbi:hypothetical protein HAX54_023998 [Datura stramonium]|uniref:PHD-type domain-containing protein n=1 Tax=Datura stramonium TaxID=4076 RepID=A0ABS8UYP8_DATST|nr:hypothetical protein [Datura stramonium]